MNQMPISKPLLLLLLLSAALTIVVMLRPEVAVAPEPVDLLAERPATEDPLRADSLSSPWQRSSFPDVSLGKEGGGLLPPAPPPPVTPPPAAVVPMAYVPPPKPEVPTPRFTYLGRMESGDGAWVFLAVGDVFESVKAGDVIDSTWRIKHITAEGVELEYLPLRETRWLSATR